jgi:hypothetical protein
MMLYYTTALELTLHSTVSDFEDALMEFIYERKTTGEWK